MISLLEALNFRSLRYVKQRLDSFHVLVGPNASGKSTFLEVVSFLGKLVSEGVDKAVGERTEDFRDLVWNRHGSRFELAVEARVPEELKKASGIGSYDSVRYEVAVSADERSGVIGIAKERLFLFAAQPEIHEEILLFPNARIVPETILTGIQKGVRTIVSKSANGNSNFNSETHDKPGKGWINTFKLSAEKSALGNLPPDETKFPVSTWLKGILTEGVQPFILNSLMIRRASPPHQRRGFRTDGSNIPWVIRELKKDSARYAAWLAHVKTALPDIQSIDVIDRPDDNHCYLQVRYKSGLEAPSWVVSDGTLRLFALTLPAYVPSFKGVYLIEEPENGIHPKAVETVFQSLSSAYDAQILIASHSPVILNIADIRHLLCFAKTDEGSTDVVSGPDHPRLREWKGEANLGLLFAAGVLG
jgi:predicted ATPase